MTTLEQLERSDRSLSLPLDGIGLIEASAGTGKTFTIAGLYARMVVEQKRAVRNILVMTFTRAAAEELRTRLRERLQLCAQLQDDPAGQPDGPEPETTDPAELRVLALLRRTRRAGDEDDDALRRRIRDAVQRMDEAVVTTIHGFCQRVLSEYAAWIDAGGPDLTLEPSDDDLLEDIAADLWLTVAGRENDAEQAGLSPPPAGSGRPGGGGAEGPASPHGQRSAQGRGQLEALQTLASSPDNLAGVLKGLVAYDGKLQPQPAAKLPAAVDMDAAWQQLFTAWQQHGNEACQVFDKWHADARLHKGQYDGNAAHKLLVLYERLAAESQPGSDQLQKFSLAKLQNAVNKAAQKDHGTFPDLPAFAAIDRWLQAAEAHEARLQAQAVALLHELRDAASRELARRKRELQRHSYDDLIAHLRDALRAGADSELATRLRQQFPCAMVDEFQDTSRRQWQILAALYGRARRGDGHGHGLLMIGDPKQAIYRFRGGDVHTYLQAAELAGDNKASLAHNFRSTPAMLDAVEALFRQRDQVFMEPGIDFQHVDAGAGRAGGLTRDGEALKPLTLWPLPEHIKSADERRDAIARATALQIAGLLDPRVQLDDGEQRQPVEPGQIAVLVSTNNESLLMLEALRTVGVPAVSVQKRSVFASDQAHELLRLLDGLLAPGALARVRGALATELMGATLADLQADDDAHDHRQLDRITELRRIWQTRGVLAMLEDVIEQRATELLALADGERRLGNLMQLGELAQEAEPACAGGRALRDWLARRIRDADHQREDEQLRLESDAKCVQVMTLHGSKGLEFDLVLLPFMALRAVRLPKKGELAGFHDDADEPVKRLLTSTTKPRDPADQDALDRVHREALAEDVRVLYVGITRARYACWMSVAPGAVAGKKKAAGKADVLPRKILDWVLPGHADGSQLAADHDDLVALEPMPDTSLGKARMPTPPQLGDARRFSRRLRRDWWVHSFSQLNRGRRERQVDDPADHDEAASDAAIPADVVEVVNQPRGPDYGNAVHVVFEHADFDAWRDVDVVRDEQQALIERQLRQAGYSGAELESASRATATLIRHSINTPFIGATRLVDLPPQHRAAEMRFHFGIAGADEAALLQLLQQHGYQRQRRHFASLRGELRGLMHGIIDLVCRCDEQWWVVDYKSNHLGDRFADYDRAGMQAAVEHAGYDLQYLIYTVAAHRWLGQVLGADYDYARDFGGIRYLFLRGMHAGHPGRGVFMDKPAIELIEQLDRLLAAPGRAAA